MGGPLAPGDPEGYCTGEDVIKALNEAFGSPESPIYQKAKADDVFSTVNTGSALSAAYAKAGMTVSANWNAYLLGLSDANAEAIAKARSIALNQGLPITTSAHKYASQHHHDVTISVSDTLTAISSPFLNDVPPS